MRLGLGKHVGNRLHKTLSRKLLTLCDAIAGWEGIDAGKEQLSSAFIA